MKRVIIMLLDSFAVGASEDANKYQDQGADTLGHIAQACLDSQDPRRSANPLSLPNLAALGLFKAHQKSTGTLLKECDCQKDPVGAWGFAQELSLGKDTPSGHWEIAGTAVLSDWGYFRKKENSFPESLLADLIQKENLTGLLGNCQASGTEIIARLGAEHCQSRKPIVYTSADSVFQIAAHEQHFGLDRLLSVCRTTYELLKPYNINRVIARPFIGENEYIRTGNRRDFTLPPPSPTVLDKMVKKQGKVIAIGKTADIFAHQGISETVKATGLDGLFDATLRVMQKNQENSILFTNFVDFDSYYGHRRDPIGYALALEQLDSRLPELFAQLGADDLVIFTADHGCDPTWPGTDHTREHIPVLVYGHKVKPIYLGKRETFADIGQTLSDYFDLEATDYGVSFLKDISPNF